MLAEKVHLGCDACCTDPLLNDWLSRLAAPHLLVSRVYHRLRLRPTTEFDLDLAETLDLQVVGGAVDYAHLKDRRLALQG